MSGEIEQKLERAMVVVKAVIAYGKIRNTPAHGPGREKHDKLWDAMWAAADKFNGGE